MNDRSTYKDLATNTVVYMIGTALSKVLNFVILPYISCMISSEQYGVYDAVQTISSLLLPIVTLQAIDAAFRFMYEASDREKEKVLSNVWMLLLFGIVIATGIGIILNYGFLHISYFWLLLIYTLTNIIVNMFQRVARSYNMRKVYAISGIIQTAILLVMQFIFLKYTKLGESGLVYAYAISALLTSFYIEINTRSLKRVHCSLIDIDEIKRIVKFSAPLVPNSISWWGVSSVGRILIITVIGYSANGIYSMSNKFAGLITMVTSTFLLAFQEHAITEKDKSDCNTNSKVFNQYVYVLACGTSALLLFQQIYFKMFIDSQYAESVQYIPIVMLSMFFSSISSFYGTGYFAYEKTSGAFKTTLYGALINIVLSFVSIRFAGLWGIAFSSAIAYLAMCLFRHYSMKSYFTIDIDKKIVLVCGIMLLIATYVFYLNSILLSVVTIVLIGIYMLIYYRKEIEHLAATIMRKK